MIDDEHYNTDLFHNITSLLITSAFLFITSTISCTTVSLLLLITVIVIILCLAQLLDTLIFQLFFDINSCINI